MQQAQAEAIFEVLKIAEDLVNCGFKVNVQRIAKHVFDERNNLIEHVKFSVGFYGQVST